MGAAHSRSLDAAKRDPAGVGTVRWTVGWFILQEDEYRPLPAGADGVLRSRVLPGLWLDTAGLLAEDGARVLTRLQEGLQSAEHASFAAELQRRAG